MSSEPTYIVYDGECPFCSQFVRLVRLREAAGPVILLNAREDHPIVRLVKERGVVLDQEMAWVSGNQIYSGAECMNRIALMSTKSGLFNKLNALVFSSPRVSRALYPILRACRNLTLKILGRRPIET